MHLIVPHSWLKELCKTNLAPEKIAARISLSGPSVDRVTQRNGDTFYDVEITTNRPDAFSMIGFAREVAAILAVPFTELLDEKKLAKKANALLPKKKAKSDYALKVRIENPDLCNRYTGLVIDHVVVRPSPAWMQRRLEQCGQRAINNIVDITNYVMLEYGQPMHAFDADKLVCRDAQGAHLLRKEIIVRNAKPDEAFVTLDGDTKTLKPTMLVIADHDGPVALAGIKGGKRSGIDATTNTIILEAAHFNAVNVRTTSREVDVRTDSSSRFEKNLSPHLPPYALIRAAELLREYADGEVVSPVIDCYPKKAKTTSIRFLPSDVTRVIGVPISAHESARNLSRLGFSVKKSGESLTVRVPFWRQGDVENSRDCVEEVSRLHGYDRIPLESIRGSIPMDARDPLFFWESHAKHFLKALGWTEMMSYSFVSEKLLEKSGVSRAACVKVTNPLSLEFEYMRPSILSSLLDALSSNEQKSETHKMFELSTVYHPNKKLALPHEPQMLTGVLIRKSTKQELFREVKGALEALGAEVFGARAHELSFVKIEKGNHWIAGSMGTDVYLGKTYLGFFGMLKSSLSSAFDLKTPACIFELSFTAALSFMSMSRAYTPIPKYPFVQRDVALLVSKEHSYASLVQAIKSVDPLITDVSLFDIFESAKLGKDKHSLAFRLTYYSGARTLQSLEVEDVHSSVQALLQKSFNAALR